MINRMKLRSFKQGHDQPVKQYVGQLKQIARMCQFLRTCSWGTCIQRNDYSDEMVLDQLEQGLNDNEVQMKVLAYDKDNFNLESIKKLITTKEYGKATAVDGSQVKGIPIAWERGAESPVGEPTLMD